MKRLIIIVAIAASCFFSDAYSALAQSRTGVVTASSMVVTRTKIKSPTKIRWQDNIYATTTLTQHHEIAYSGGWRFGNFLFMGFGAGVQMYPNVLPWDENSVIDMNNKGEDLKLDGDKYYSPSKIAVPVFAQIKFRFLKTRISPYLYGKGGLLCQGMVAHEGDYRTGKYYKDGIDVVYYATFSFGLDIKLNDESSISLGLGPILTGQEENYLDPSEDTRITTGINLEFSF